MSLYYVPPQVGPAGTPGISPVTTTSSATIPSGTPVATAVTISNSEFIAVSTSIIGALGSIIGTLSRASGGSYSFTPSTALAASVTLATGTIFVAASLPSSINPLKLGDSILTDIDLGTSVYFAFTDLGERVSWGVLSDGTLFANKTAQMSISGNAATAQSLITSAGDKLQDYVNLDFYYSIEVDAADRIFRAITSDGTNYMPKAAVDSLSAVSATVQTLTVTTLNAANFSASQFTAVHGTDGVFAVEAVSGTNQIIRYNNSNGARTQLTTIGANTAPSLTAETPARILFASARTGSQTYQVMKTDGSELAFAIPPKTIAMWGDSMTAGLSSSGWLPTKLGDGRTIRFRGVGGQTSVQIASRQSGLTITGTVAGGQIPASGAVAITGLYPSPVTAQGGDGLYSINGIIGTLAFNGGSPTFTRSTAGSAVSVTNPATIIPVLDDTINSVVYNLNEYTAVLWLGRNGIGGSQGETDVSIYTAMLSKFRNLAKRILILPIFNGGYSTESDGDTAIPTIGTSGYTSIMNRNASVAAAFPQNWYDIRRQFIDGAEAWLNTKYPAIYATDWTQAFPDRTQASLGPNSAWDVANDVPPRALRGDNIHLNAYGNEFLAELLAARIQSLSW